MARCVECAHYPWVPEADPGLLPAQPCHPDLPWQRWTAETRDMKRDCPYFEARDGVKAEAKEQPKEQPKAEAKPRKKG